VYSRHRLDDLPRKQFAHCADTDESRRLEVLDSGDDLWVFRCQVEMIEGLAGRQLVRVGQLVCGKSGTSCNHQSLGVEQPDLLPGRFGRDALLAQRRDNEVGKSDGCGARSEKEDPLLLELAPGYLERVDQSRKRDAGRALDVVIVAGDLVAVA